MRRSLGRRAKDEEDRTVDSSEKVEVVVDGKKASVPDPREDDALKRVLKDTGTLKEAKAPHN